MFWMRTAGSFQRRAAPAPRAFSVRPVHPADEEAMRQFVDGLSTSSRRWRFHGSINACSPALLRQLIDVEASKHVAFVACKGEMIVGEARYVVGHDGAEFAMAVADASQGGGVADALLRSLLAAASAAGVRRLYGDVLEGNARMAGFMSRHGFDVEVDLWNQLGAGVVRWQCATKTSRRRRAHALLVSGGMRALQASLGFGGRFARRFSHGGEAASAIRGVSPSAGM